MDTSVMEYTAEDLIAHKLQRSSLLVAKPKFDQEGADLLAFLEVSDGAKFCRIQCKGRSLANAKSAKIEVRKDWVTEAFVVFLFVETGQPESTFLFCFLPDDIRDAWTDKSDIFSLSVTHTKLNKGLSRYKFDETKIQRIKAIIRVSDVRRELSIIHGRLASNLDDVTLHSTGTVGQPPPPS